MKLISTVLFVAVSPALPFAFRTIAERHQHVAMHTTTLFSTPAARAAAYDTMVVNVDERAERDLWSFQEWADSCGVQKCEGFEIQTNDGSDYYVVTTQDLQAGSPVVYVPSQMVLSSNRASEEFGSSLQVAEQQLNEGNSGNQIPLFRLVVKILSEFEKGESSPWYPWLNSLPRRVS